MFYDESLALPAPAAGICLEEEKESQDLGEVNKKLPAPKSRTSDEIKTFFPNQVQLAEAAMKGEEEDAQTVSPKLFLRQVI